MKNIVSFILIFFLTGNLFSQYKPLVPDFRINEDNYPATFIQRNPKLFSNDNKFIVSWGDDRNGDKSYYAQYFDSSGKPIGRNFKVNSNYDICFGNNNRFIGIRKNYVSDNIYGGGSIGYFASIYDSTNKVIADNISLDYISLPWCGFGYKGSGTKIIKTKNGYLFGARDNSKLRLQRMDGKGNITHKFNFSDSLNLSVISFDMVSLGEAQFLTAWVGNAPTYDTTKIVATIFNEDTLKKSTLFDIKNLNGNDFINGKNTLKNIAVNDSVVLIFDIFNDSLRLNYRKYNIKGERLTQDSVIDLDYNEPLEQGDIKSFEIVKTPNKNIDAFISIRYSGYKYLNKIIVFDEHGDFLDIYSQQTEGANSYLRKPFFTTDKDYLMCNQSANDIYLFGKNMFNTQDSLKVNDDEIGSNDIAPVAVPINNSKYLVTWKSEGKSYFGKIVNENNDVAKNQILLEGKNTLVINNVFVNFWKKKLNEDTGLSGFTVYDSDWNKIKKDTFQTGDYYKMDFDFQKLSNYLFLLITSNTKNTKLILYNFLGNKEKEKIISTKHSYNLRLFGNNNNTVWVGWNANLQLFDITLNTLSKVYNNPASIYLGYNKFMHSIIRYLTVGSELVGTLLNEKGEAIGDEFVFEDVNLFSGQNEYKIVPLNSTEFLILFSGNEYNNGSVKYNLYWKLYNYNNRELHFLKQKITNDKPVNVKDISATVNNDKIFFVWSDLREGNHGYDIYGNIYNLNEITSVESKKINMPENFSLSQNYPNPFNPTTTIEYQIPEHSAQTNVASDFSPSNVELKIYDILGKEVTTLVNKKQNPGNYKVIFDASNLSSGVYYYKLKSGNFVKTKKMLLIK